MIIPVAWWISRRLRAHAFATDNSVADIAQEIVNRRLRFPSDSL